MDRAAVIDGYVSLAAVARRSGVQLRRVQKAAAEGRIRGARTFMGRWIVRERAFTDWLDNGKHRPGPAKGTKRQERRARQQPGGQDGH